MNKRSKTSLYIFLTNLFSGIVSVIIIVMILRLVYKSLLIFNVSIPKDSIFLNLLNLDFINLLKISSFILAAEIILWYFIQGIVVLVLSIRGRIAKPSPTKEKIFELRNRILSSIYIPLVAIFSLSDSQLSSFINLSALVAIFLFIFRFKRE